MFFSSLILQYNSLCQKKSHFCLWFVLSTRLCRLNVKSKKQKKSHGGAPQLGLSQSDSLLWKIHKNGCRLDSKSNLIIKKNNITMGTWSSHIPEQFPSLRSTRCRRCSGKPPSFFWSWWPHNIYLWVLLPGRTGNSPSGGSYWWMCMFSAAGGASAAPWPSLPDTWILDMKWGEFFTDFNWSL